MNPASLDQQLIPALENGDRFTCAKFERRYHRCSYGILVSRSDKRPLAQLYGFGVREKIPVFPLPLQLMDMEPVVDLQ